MRVRSVRRGIWWDGLEWALVGTVAAFLVLAVATRYSRADDPYADLPVDPRDPPVVQVVPPAPPVHVAAIPGTTPPVTVPKPPAPATPPPPVVSHAPPVPVEPPPTFFGRDVASESGSLIYVIDVSGSMATTVDNTGQSRLDLAKRELRRSVSSLPQSFRFNLIAYDCLASWCFDGNLPNGQPRLVPATPAAVAKARAWVEALRADGATGTGPACVMALQARSNKLLLVLTDGAPNCGAGDGMGGASCMDAHLSQVRWSNQQGAVIDVFGICAYGSFKDFCVRLAALGGGSYRDVR